MNKKKVIVFCLAVITILSIAGCSKKTSNVTSDFIIWYEASSVKIIQDDGGKASKEAADKQTLKVNMARNESEGVQLMMYTKKDISKYEVSVSDLKCKNEVIANDAIDVYQVKYMLKEESLYSDGNPAFPTGSRIPDALLPFEKAVEYEENAIEKGHNQSIYLDIATTTETKAGLYEGVVNVKVGSKEYKMPLEVNVYDVVYPDTSKLKTAYSMFDVDTFASAELDGSSEQYIKYYETLLDYNMACALPFEGEGGIERYLELIKTYYNYPGFSSYRLYYAPGKTYRGETGYFNGDLMHEYLVAIADMSIEDEIDYLDKAYFYGYNIVDEPTTEDGYRLAQKLHAYWVKILQGVDTELREKYAGTDKYEYYENVISKTVLTIPNVMPATYTIEVAEKLYGYTYVPIIDNFTHEYERKAFRDLSVNGELWTYTCVGPKYPYPSAHTDDYALGFRLTSWMCFDYNIDAFLMWASTHNVKGANGEIVSDPWTDIYDGFSRPGDGKYFYPGEKYGLDTPCPTITAMQYRDGVDDYSLLQAFEDIYSQYGLDAHTLLAESFAKLYTGVVPITDSYVFESIRQNLFQQIENSNKNTAVVYANKTVVLGKATLELFTTNDMAEVIVEGQKAEKSAKGSYVFEIDLTKGSEFKFTVQCSGEKEEHVYRLINGAIGAITDFEKVESVESFVNSNSKGYEVDLNTNSKYSNNSNKSLHVSINKNKENIIPYFTITKESMFLDSQWDNLKSMQFMVYNAGAQDLEMMATYYTTQETMIENFTLKAGEWTMVEIVAPEDVELHTIQEYSFNFARESTVDLYIDDFAVVVEEE